MLPAARPARGQKKEYEVLSAGREALREWVALAEDPRPVRDPLLLRMRAAAVVGAPGLAGELRRHLALHREQLAKYLEIERRDFPPERTADEDRLRRLVLRGGIDLETFWTGWLTRAIDELDGPGPEGGSPDAPRPSQGVF